MKKLIERPRIVALGLPMFYEYAQRVRRGILDWTDHHGSWQVIEIDPASAQLAPELRTHLDGVILWHMAPDPIAEEILTWGLPTVEVGSKAASRSTKPTSHSARISFDRSSINDLAVDHFRKLGIESIGYVGQNLGSGRELAKRVSDLKKKVLEAGLEWTSHELGANNPVSNPCLIWRGLEQPALSEFLKSLPPATGLLTQDDYIGVMICTTAEAMGLSIPGDLAVLGQGDRTIGRSGSCPLSSVVIPGEIIGGQAASLLEEWMQGSPPENRQHHLRCQQILVRRSTGGVSGEPSIERAKRYFDRHVLDGVTVGELASLAGCTAPTLRKRFQQSYGFEITTEAKRRRTARILEMLADSDLEIQEIGEKCGFPSPPNFFNFVKRQTGMGPSAYRQQAKAGAAR